MFTAKMILHRDTRNNFITVIKKKKKKSVFHLHLWYLHFLGKMSVVKQNRPINKIFQFPLRVFERVLPAKSRTSEIVFHSLFPRDKSVVKRERESTPVQSFNRARDTRYQADLSSWQFRTFNSELDAPLSSYELAVGETERVAYMINRTFPPLLPLGHRSKD